MSVKKNQVSGTTKSDEKEEEQDIGLTVHRAWAIPQYQNNGRQTIVFYVGRD